ncbi:hypothetical protein IQ06DRAFT_311619 [Phaeosphaeriaceae sp. SRC1lsM3a]|nr:hypothetical protein IQ06DRAFT_311619 [Stagonospora sp. SRC1lsM3a]
MAQHLSNTPINLTDSVFANTAVPRKPGGGGGGGEPPRRPDRDATRGHYLQAMSLWEILLARISKGALVNSIQSVQVLLDVIRHIKNQHPDMHPLVELAADMTIVRKPDWRSLLDTSFAHLFSVKPATDSVADVVEFWARILAVIFHCAAGSDSVMPCDECRDGHGMFNTCRVQDDASTLQEGRLWSPRTMVGEKAMGREMRRGLLSEPLAPALFHTPIHHSRTLHLRFEPRSTNRTLESKQRSNSVGQDSLELACNPPAERPVSSVCSRILSPLAADGL